MLIYFSVLFHGPPGTGKTLLARALAAECSQEGRKVAFFMRKGADCLNKWIGESERQLRLLFDQAYVSVNHSVSGPFRARTALRADNDVFQIPPTPPSLAMVRRIINFGGLKC